MTFKYIVIEEACVRKHQYFDKKVKYLENKLNSNPEGVNTNLDHTGSVSYVQIMQANHLSIIRYT